MTRRVGRMRFALRGPQTTKLEASPTAEFVYGLHEHAACRPVDEDSMTVYKKKIAGDPPEAPAILSAADVTNLARDVMIDVRHEYRVSGEVRFIWEDSLEAYQADGRRTPRGIFIEMVGVLPEGDVDAYFTLMVRLARALNRSAPTQRDLSIAKGIVEAVPDEDQPFPGYSSV